jgi:hypothetical protein
VRSNKARVCKTYTLFWWTRFHAYFLLPASESTTWATERRRAVVGNPVSYSGNPRTRPLTGGILSSKFQRTIQKFYSTVYRGCNSHQTTISSFRFAFNRWFFIHPMSRTVSHCSHTAYVRIQSQLSPGKICGYRRTIKLFFLPVVLYSLSVLSTTCTIIIFPVSINLRYT